MGSLTEPDCGRGIQHRDKTPPPRVSPDPHQTRRDATVVHRGAQHPPVLPASPRGAERAGGAPTLPVPAAVPHPHRMTKSCPSISGP